MEMMNILLTVVLAGFSFNFALLYIIWARLDKLQDVILDIDRRLCRIEGALTSKDCCVLKQDEKLKKAE